MFLRGIISSTDQVRLENLYLRYQLQVYRRNEGRPRFLPHDRQILTKLALALRGWREACYIVKPETILEWHKRLVRWKWTFKKSGSAGRPSVADDLIAFVVRMKRSNPIWGAKRLHGELLKLGYRLSESSVRNILRAAGEDPGGGLPSMKWRQFLTMHKTAWAIDLFTVESAFLKTFFVLVILDIKNRVLIATSVTPISDGEWVANVLRSEMAERSTPDLLIHDHASIFRGADVKNLLVSRKVRVAMTPVYAPMANCFVERVIGSIRRECTDHFLFSGRKHLQVVLDEYRLYYNTARCHQGIDQRVPMAMENGEKGPRNPPVSTSVISAFPYLGGLHHEYRVTE